MADSGTNAMTKPAAGGTQLPPTLARPSILGRNFVLLWVATLGFFASFALLLTAMPIYAQRLGAGNPEIGLLMGLFGAAAMAARLPVGWLAERGRKVPILMVGAAIFVLSSVGYALVEFAASALLLGPVAILLGLRALHGTGMATFNTASQTLVLEVTPPGRRGEALGIYGIALNLAHGLSPAIGMALALAVGFHFLFGLSSALAVAAIALVFCIREPQPSSSTRRSARLFNPAVVGPGVALLTLMFAFGAMASFVPLYALGRGLENPGLYFMASAGAMLVSQTLTGRASDRFGRLVMIVPGLLLGSIAMVAVSSAEGWWFLAAAAVSGLGSGASHPAFFAWAGDLVPGEQRGSAMATMGFFMEAGFAAGATCAGFLAGSLGLQATFLAMAAAPLLGIVIAIASRRRQTSSPYLDSPSLRTCD